MWQLNLQFHNVVINLILIIIEMRNSFSKIRMIADYYMFYLFYLT